MKNKKRLIFFLALSLAVCSGCAIRPDSGAGQEKYTFAPEQKEEDSNSKTEEEPEDTEYIPVDIEEKQNEEETEEKMAAEGQTADTKTESILAQMTLEEKAAQLFVVLPEAMVDGVSVVTKAADATKEAIWRIPAGGFIYLEHNLQSPEQVKEMLGNVQEYSMERIGLPAFLCVDEEGGKVARVSGNDNFGIAAIESMAEVGQSQDIVRASEIGNTMGEYLFDMGFNVDFAPVADVLSNQENSVVKERSFGSDVGLVSDMAAAVAKGLEEKGVFAVYKHFPGHGMTAGDTHAGYAYSDKTLEEIEACELIPFQRAIAEGASFLMIGHISLPQITGEDIPASLSHTVIQELLREKMGYDGIVITDAMNMGAIVQQYSSAKAAVLAVEAGADLILMPEDFKAAYAGILEAVQNGTLSEERIDESVKRIVGTKLKWKERDVR